MPRHDPFECPQRFLGIKANSPVEVCVLGAQTLQEVGEGGIVRTKLQGDLGTMVAIILMCIQRKILVVHKTLGVMDIIA